MKLHFAKDSLSWLVPVAVSAFAVTLYTDDTIQPHGTHLFQKAKAVAPAPAPVGDRADYDDVVAQQAFADTGLTSLTKVAEAPATLTVLRYDSRDAPEVQTVALKAPVPVPEAPVAAKPSASVAPEAAAPAANENCAKDLRAKAKTVHVYFPVGSLTPDPAGIEDSRALAALAAACDSVKVRVNGHTDASGDDVANLVLSEQRALRVLEALNATGVDTSGFFARGFGSREPSQMSGPQPQSYYDRRVDFSIVENVTGVTVPASDTTRP